MNINDMLKADGTIDLHLQREEIRSDTEALVEDFKTIAEQLTVTQRQRQQIMDMYS